MIRLLAIAFLAAFAAPAFAASAGTYTPELVMLGPVPIDFVLFGLMLGGVAVLHHHTLQVALTGLAVITAYKLAFGTFADGPGSRPACTPRPRVGDAREPARLLLGFALLSRHFEESHVPEELPRFLPSDWRGGFLLLAIVFVLSAFLDNIAAALIGGTMARVVFRGKVHLGYLAGIVAASNAGGSGSVVGDTTTTMMWIQGVSPRDVLHAYIAAVIALLISGFSRRASKRRTRQSTRPMSSA